jgi:molybdopterin synthase sulfur carrier subunit
MNVVLSGTLQKFAQYQREHVIDAATIEEGIATLVESHPDLKRALLDASGLIRSAHMIFLNGDQVGRDQLEQKVGESDQIEILTAIAGG